MNATFPGTSRDGAPALSTASVSPILARLAQPRTSCPNSPAPPIDSAQPPPHPLLTDQGAADDEARHLMRPLRLLRSFRPLLLSAYHMLIAVDDTKARTVMASVRKLVFFVQRTWVRASLPSAWLKAEGRCRPAAQRTHVGHQSTARMC